MNPNCRRTCAALAALAIGIAAAADAAAQTQIQFIGVGPSTWDNPANWEIPGGFPGLPEAQFDDIAVVGPGDFAFVDNTPAAFPGQININGGTLEIRANGNLSAIPGLEATTGTLNMNGQLLVRPGGSLGVQAINSGGGGGSTISLGELGAAEPANLTVSGGQLNRITRLEAPNVNFSSSGDLGFGAASVLVPVITAQGQAIINVAGEANLGGQVRPEFEGVTPQFGDSWDLITAGAINGHLGVDATALQTPRGTVFTVTNTATTATLRLTNQLLLTADASTGAIEIENVLGNPITFDAYTISSPSGSLGGNWNSLQHQATGGWDQAATADAFRLTEVNPLGSSTLGAGQKLSLGTPLAPVAPSAFGEPLDQLTFQYGLEGNLVDAVVEFTSPENNFVLTIDPTTGQAAFQNESPFFNVDIDAYTITSASGALLPGAGNWDSLSDQGIDAWDEAATSDAFRLTEVLPIGTTRMNGGGTVMNLGTPISLPGVNEDPLSPEDFEVIFGLGGQLIPGIIKFGPIPTAGLLGDFNGDGVVDGSDLTGPNGWEERFGADLDGTDFLNWQRNLGTGGGALAGAASVPEPTAWLLLALATLSAHACGAGRR